MSNEDRAAQIEQETRAKYAQGQGSPDAELIE